MATKKTTTKKTIKATPRVETPTRGAKEKESSLVFWMALFIVSIAIVGGGILTTMPREEKDSVEDSANVEEGDGDMMDEMMENEVDAVTVRSIYDQYVLEGYPAAGNASVDLQEMLREALQTGLLVEVDRLHIAALDDIRIMSVPDKDVNQEYCGIYGQSLCVVMRQKNVNNVEILGFFSTLSTTQGFPEGETGTVGEMQMVGDKLLISMGMGDAGVSMEDAFTIDLNTKYRALIGSATSTQDERGWAITTIKRGDLEVTIDTNGTNPSYLLSSASDSTSVLKGQVDEFGVDWVAMLDRPEEIHFAIGSHSYVFNRGGLGTFQIK
ncbi:hypothetical protein COV06_01120 [Candidatus Uhrbacteria bacterium CG10_big_fil_rev_8_21_14_0_10_50_16]|uniref:Uncharacterized protein n=1 Tax=Candidatus Uhrbacteria bacterium CG10_big_fil_rev_8_21_14_0_10_50_16 TaxID=1975039 RepID=A0A2H0RPS2_9BACT|nr:MAG: hypothetical protein COV06_01120 [Candidatus Uhrbacteria bacterium CG10_big_fil_rev_8_21_14_0_10_50_16]